VCVVAQLTCGEGISSRTLHHRFNPDSPAFTLDSVVSLRLDAHAEFISELSSNATKEAAIEGGLEVRYGFARAGGWRIAHTLLGVFVPLTAL